jgi:hypothetical protein
MSFHLVISLILLNNLHLMQTFLQKEVKKYYPVVKLCVIKNRLLVPDNIGFYGK